MENIKKCPICNGEKSRNVGTKGDFSLQACAKCKSLFAVKVSAQTQSFSYDDYYDESNLAIPDFVHQRLDEIVSEFAPFRKNGCLLDVGCGAGVFLSAAKKAGWQAEGVEVSKPSVEHLHSQGFKVFHGTLEEAKFPDNHFDVVIATEVLEHVTEPKPLVEEIARILRPGGLFWGTTPHGKGLSAKMIGTEWSVIAPPEHLQLFSVAGMKNMFKESGFSQIEINTGATNPFELMAVLRKKLSKNSKSKEAAKYNEQNFNRVESSYELNESLSKSSLGKSLKNILNGMLNLTQLGDSIKFKAVK